MIDTRFVPITTWPAKETPSHSRQKSRFATTYSKTLDLLEKELNQIRAKEVLIQTWMDRSQIRNDGWPKSNAARPSKPGVILTFTRNGKTISMPCDRFTTWEDNLRAIALSLEALRTVDRYGVTQNGEQYRGWESLPPPVAQAGMSSEMAIEILSRWSSVPKEWIREDRLQYRKEAATEAQKRTHPDKGGTADDFRLVREAIRILGVP